MTGRDTGRPSEGPATRLLLHRRSLLGAGVAFGLTASPLAAPRPELRPLSESDPGVVPTAPPPQLEMTEGLVDVGDGHRLRYLDTAGGGVPVVLLHAATGSVDNWCYQVPALAKAGYRVACYSRRGCRGSVAGDLTRPGSAAGDLLKLVDHLGLPTFHLIGTAAGGFYAADFATSHPQRLKSLVLANTLVGVRNDDYRAIYARLLPKEFEQLPPDFRELSPSYRHLDPEGRQRWIALEHGARTVTMGPPGLDNMITWDTLAAWRMPVLVLTGTADLYAPPSIARLLQSRIPGAELVVIPDAGHSAYWERPQLWNERVLAFIDRHKS